jgi:hypothetical protein
MADPLSELKKDLEVLAKPNLSSEAQPEALLKVVQGLFEAIEQAGDPLGSVMKTLHEAIQTGFEDVAGALKTIAKEVEELGAKHGNGGGLLNTEEVTQALTGLQNGLSTAAALVPSTKSVGAVGAPVLELISQLLKGTSFTEAAKTLEEIAQQLDAIGKAL